MKKSLCIALLASISLQAHAGFWDSVTGFFSSPEPNSTAQSPAAQTTSSAPNLMQTGLQLLPLLTQQLGVSNAQAKGGMGALLQATKILLSGTDYAALAQAIPNTDALIAAAPNVAKTTQDDNNLLNSALKMASEYSDTAKTGSQLVSQFQSLGLSADMIPKFTGVANDYLKQTDSADAAQLLTSALSSFL